MTDQCPFCAVNKLKPRIFYDGDNWFGILAAPGNTRGHAILAAKANDQCPDILEPEVLNGLDRALADVVRILKAHYQPKDIVFASLRAKEPHFHCHILPVWSEEEREWRHQTGHEEGHLLEFLGLQEHNASNSHQAERKDKGWSEEDQRTAHEIALGPDIQGLRNIAGY